MSDPKTSDITINAANAAAVTSINSAAGDASTSAAATSVSKPTPIDKAKKPGKPELVPTLVVKGPQQGRWRAGRKFGREPVSIPRADLTDAAIEALKADPELSVQEIDAPY